MQKQTEGRSYLFFSAASGAAIWRLPEGIDPTPLKDLVNQYNTREEWAKRGYDGSVELCCEAELPGVVFDQYGLDNVSDDTERDPTMEDVVKLVEQAGDINREDLSMETAVSILNGQADGLSGQ